MISHEDIAFVWVDIRKTLHLNSNPADEKDAPAPNSGDLMNALIRTSEKGDDHYHGAKKNGQEDDSRDDAKCPNPICCAFHDAFPLR